MLGSNIEFSTAPVAGGGAATIYKLSGAGAPVNGVTGVGVVGPGEIYFDSTNKVPYINQGSLAVPEYHGFNLN